MNGVLAQVLWFCFWSQCILGMMVPSSEQILTPDLWNKTRGRKSTVGAPETSPSLQGE